MKTDVTIHIASEADLDALVRLAVAFRDHVGESTPSAQEFCASLVVLLHDASAEFFLASTPTGAAVGYVHSLDTMFVHWFISAGRCWYASFHFSSIRYTWRS